MKYLGVLLSLLVLIGIVSCSKKKVPVRSDPNYSSTLELITADNDTLQAGTYNPDFIKARIINEIDEPVPGIEVILVQISPNDRTNPFNRTDTTDVDGNIIMAYRADTLVGSDTIQILASGIDDSVVYLPLTVIPDIAKTLIRLTPGATLVGVAGQPLADTIKVKVLDQFANPIPNHRVFFKASGRCLIVTDSTADLPVENDSIYSRTDSAGIARGVWHLSINPVPGFGYPNSFTLRIKDEEADSVLFSAASTTPGSITYYNNTRPVFEANCFLCHPTNFSLYSMNTYDSTVTNPIVIPNDTLNSTMLDYAYATETDQDHFNLLNLIEQDIIKLWIANNALEGTPPPPVAKGPELLPAH